MRMSLDYISMYMFFIPQGGTAAQRASHWNAGHHLTTWIPKLLLALISTNKAREFLFRPSAAMGFFSNTGSVRCCRKSQVQKTQPIRNGCPQFMEEVRADVLQQVTTVNAIFQRKKKVCKGRELIDPSFDLNKTSTFAEWEKVDLQKES